MRRRKVRRERGAQPQEETMLRRKLAQAREEKGAESVAWQQQQQRRRRRQQRSLPQTVSPRVLLSHQKSRLSDRSPQGCQGKLKPIQHALRFGFSHVNAPTMRSRTFDCFFYACFWHEGSWSLLKRLYVPFNIPFIKLITFYRVYNMLRA